ncbi:MAG: mqnA [Bacteroidetes bacterium]|nr:mqnA [Bacteroidota bacterium]
MSKQKRLGIPPHLYCTPLLSGLEASGKFLIAVDVDTRNAINLRHCELDGAFLSPIDYARESSQYCIIPNVAVSSRTPTGTVVLHFKEGLHTIKTLAVHPTSTSEVVLASILLSEQFDVRPQIVPSMGTLEQMLQSADAALLVGNAALEQAHDHRNNVDLVEEWFDMTGLPYVHGFWCLREGDIERDDIVSIQRTCERSIKSLAEIAKAETAKRGSRFSSTVLEEYLERFSFVLADAEQGALMEFFRYAYYHGVLPDVADLHFYPFDNASESPYSNLSMN